MDSTLVGISNLSINPYRAACRTELISTNSWADPTATGMTASYQTEPTEATDTSLTLAQPSYAVQRAHAFAAVSHELGEDYQAILPNIGRMIQDAKDDLEATKFTTGTGTNEPSGLLTGATGTIASGTAGNYKIADLIAVQSGGSGLAPRYRPRAQWFGNLAQYNKIILNNAGDFTTGSPIWLPNLQTGVPTAERGGTGYNLLGDPANEVTAMTSAIITGSKVLAYGDPTHFVLIDRVGMDIEVVSQLYCSGGLRPMGQRGIYAFWRNTSKLIDASAFKLLVTG